MDQLWQSDLDEKFSRIHNLFENIINNMDDISLYDASLLPGSTKFCG